MSSGRQAVVVVRRVDDEDGTFTDVEKVTVEGCSVQPQAPSESYDTGQRSARRFRVFGPPELSIARGQDVLEVDGSIVGAPGVVRLTLDGSPGVWPSRGGRSHHVELQAVWSAG